MTQTPSVPPSCFAKEWDQKAPECVGGLDLEYTSPTGSHIRSPCRWFQQCGMRTQAMKSLPQVGQPVVPLAHLLQPPRALQPAPMDPRLTALAQSMTRPVLTPAPQQAQAMQYLSVDYRMPSYLTVLEPIDPEEGVWRPLGRELLRAILKAAGHTLASFVDRVIFRGPRKEP